MDTSSQKNVFTFFSQSRNKQLISSLKTSHPDGNVILKSFEKKAMLDVWMNDGLKYDEVPDKILHMNRLPLPDLNLMFVEDEYPSTHRVMIYHYFYEVIKIMDKDTFIIGHIISPIMSIDDDTGKVTTGKIIVPLEINNRSKRIKCTPRFGYINLDINFRKMIMEDIEWQQRIMERAYNILGVWFGIQWFSLHPPVREMLEKMKIDLDGTDPKSENKRRKKRNRKTKFIKYHLIRVEDIVKVIKGKRIYTPREAAWHVIGHDRHFDDGRKCWVQPYWKGPLRHLGENITSDRERIIPIIGSSVNK